MAIFSTDVERPVALILAQFVRRWNVEVTFEETRRHLGVETQRQWSDLAIARTTPALFALVSLVCLMAHRWVSKIRGDFFGRVGPGQPGALGRKVFHELNGSAPTSRIDPGGLGSLAGSTCLHSLNGQSRDP